MIVANGVGRSGSSLALGSSLSLEREADAYGIGREHGKARRS